MLNYRLCITVLLLSVTVASHGEMSSIGVVDSEPQLHWVVGSFRDRQAALAQSEKLSEDTGMFVLVARAEVAGEALYRLVIAAREDAPGRERQRAQLNSVGIDKPWTMRLDVAEAMIYPGYADVAQTDVWYLVLASFTDSAEARLFADSTDGKIGLSSSIRTVELNGLIYHRVLMGPYYRVEDAQFTRQMVMDAKIDGAWILTESSDSTAGRYADLFDELVTESTAALNEAPIALNEAPIALNEAPIALNEAPIALNEAPSDEAPAMDKDAPAFDVELRQEQRDLPEQNESGYNFATLKRRTEPFPFKAPGSSKKKNTQPNGPVILQ